MKVLEIFSNIIINAGIAHGFLIAILYGRKKNQHSFFLLSLLLIDLSLIVFRIHYLRPDPLDELGYSFFGSGPFIFLLGPLLFFYLRSLVRPEKTLIKADARHFVPFAIYLVLVTPVYLYGKEGVYPHYLLRIIGSPWLFLISQFAYYLVQAYRLVKVHNKVLFEKLSNLKGMDVSWLKSILWVFVLILLFVAVATPWLIHAINFSIYNTTSSIFFSVILFFIAIRGIQQRTMPVESISGNGNDHGYPDLDTIQMQKERLNSHMRTNKPFLNPELTLTDLAKQMAISRNQLSQVINNGFGENFYNFVNKFRIEEVKDLIRKDSKKRYTIWSLANTAGFNSKSSFNNIFKKMTGLTPSEYRDGQN